MAKGKKGKFIWLITSKWRHKIGKSKNANLTEEERHQKELEKRAAEEAERIAQQQMILNYLKDKLAKEEKYARLNNKKLVGKFSFWSNFFWWSIFAKSLNYFGLTNFVEIQSEAKVEDLW